MKEAERQTLAAKLSYLHEQLETLDGYKRISAKGLLRHLERRLAVERLLELALQSMIDCSRMIVSMERWQGTNPNRDSLEILAEHQVITGALSRQLQKAKGFRNILVHEYMDIDPERLVDYLREDLPDLRAFGRSVARWIELRGDDDR